MLPGGAARHPSCAETGRPVRSHHAKRAQLEFASALRLVWLLEFVRSVARQEQRALFDGWPYQPRLLLLFGALTDGCRLRGGSLVRGQISTFGPAETRFSLLALENLRRACVPE